MSQTPERDPFEGLALDEEFVRAAVKREPSAADRAARAASLRAHLEVESREARRTNRLHRRVGRSVGGRALRVHAFLFTRNSLVILIVLAASVGYMWWGQGRSDPFAWSGGTPVTGWVDPNTRPTPTAAKSDTPLGVPSDPPGGGGPHLFLATQPNSSSPVAYDPCRPIQVVVNKRNMPIEAEGLLVEAMEEVSSITGLEFVLEGPTDEPAAEQRDPFQPDRYGDRWAPVLVAWSDPDEHPGLAGNVAGLGGSQPISVSPEQVVYVTGIVYLDGDKFEQILTYENGWVAAKSIVLHEFGHLLGLNHVDDESQLMGTGGSHAATFASGDLAGLASLSRGACITEL